MQARMKNPALVIPDAMTLLLDLGAIAKKSAIPPTTLYLVYLRASQINGCTLCAVMHSRELKTAGCSDERLFSVAAWHDSPAFDDAERAALALTEAVTRIGDRAEPVPDEIWNQAARHYDETSLASLVLSIAMINLWNRLNVATRQPPMR
jgi:AhpD family alkylhydroperoxidase